MGPVLEVLAALAVSFVLVIGFWRVFLVEKPPKTPPQKGEHPCPRTPNNLEDR